MGRVGYDERLSRHGLVSEQRRRSTRLRLHEQALNESLTLVKESSTKKTTGKVLNARESHRRQAGHSVGRGGA